MPNLKLGKKAARPGAVRFKLTDYLKTSDFPPIPKTFGHQSVFPSNGWAMLGNDQYGDCVWAGAAHETMLWNRAAKRPDVPFNDHSVLSDYSAVTGFNPNDPNSDQGTDMQQAADYRRKTGIVDSSGNRHKVVAYLAVDHKDMTQMIAAAYLFGAVGVGIEFPASAMDQFNAGHKWTVVSHSSIEGGHYIPLVGKHSTTLYCVTWGQLQPMTEGFLHHYCDEAVVYLTDEMLDPTSGKSPEGFDIAKLQSDLSQLKPA